MSVALALQAEVRAVGAVERRYYRPELRTVAGRDGSRSITGYTAVFNSLSRPLGFFREKIRPGAFADSLRSDDVVALFNHDPNFPLGRTSNGLLRLAEDGRGLRMDLSPTPTTYAADLMSCITDGTVRGQSFSFMTGRDRWTAQGESEVRELIQVALLDVSPVVFPAYTDTDVSVRGDGGAHLPMEAAARNSRVAVQYRAAVDARNRATCTLCGAPATGGSVEIDWRTMSVVGARCAQHIERTIEFPTRPGPDARHRPRLAAARRRLEALEAASAADDAWRGLQRRRRLLGGRTARRAAVAAARPANPVERRGALPYHRTGTATGAWDGAAMVARIPDGDVSALRMCHAWVDSSGDPAAKSSYKLPHHEVSAAGHVGAANIVGCRSVIAALNGGRGGVDIPRGDRQAVYDHVAHHLRDAGFIPGALK